MKIQENLLLDKHSGELIRFVDLGDINVNVPTLKNTQTLATHVLVFLVKSVVNPLSYSFATFAIDGITAYQIMSIFWQAVKYLEKNNLKVIAATGDGHHKIENFLECISIYLVIRTLKFCIEQKIFTPKKLDLFTFFQMFPI